MCGRVPEGWRHSRLQEILGRQTCGKLHEPLEVTITEEYSKYGIGDLYEIGDRKSRPHGCRRY